jgi:hypothetical protein
MLAGWPLKDRATADAIMHMALGADRASAILAGTILEDHLESRLKAGLRDSAVFDKLFDVGRPLGFFASQNQLAYLIKLYGKPFYQEMDILAQVRNKFAHSYSDKEGRFIKDFKSPAIAELVSKLELIQPLLEKKLRSAKRFSISERDYEQTKDDVDNLLSDPKRKYLETCALCASALHGYLDSEMLKAIWAETYPPPPNMMLWRQPDGSWLEEAE